MNGYEFADVFVSAFCNLARFLNEAFGALADSLDEVREMYTKSNSELLEALAAIFDENDKEEIMKNYKICEITGVPVGEVFTVRKADGTTYDATITELGLIEFAGIRELIDILALYSIINGKVTIEREPRFGEDELHTLRLLYSAGFRYLTRDGDTSAKYNIYVFANAPVKGFIDKIWCVEAGETWAFPSSLFPQVQWGDDDEKPVDIAAVLREAGMLEGDE